MCNIKHKKRSSIFSSDAIWEQLIFEGGVDSKIQEFKALINVTNEHKVESIKYMNIQYCIIRTPEFRLKYRFHFNDLSTKLNFE